jgi:8-oxo-dGTP pyrophosphatase MutT (NUDIX family)
MDHPEARVRFVDHCDLTIAAEVWPFAERHREAIDGHWAHRVTENPAFFNGRVHMMSAFSCEGGILRGRLIAVEFKAFLYWREAGETDRTVHDAFGSALIRSRDGAVVLGRQRAGNINAGLAYLPGGFIDQRDADAAGTVDIRASVLREVAEETGLGPADYTVRPGYVVTVAGRQVSIAVEIVANEELDPLLRRIRSHIAADPKSELEDVVAIRSPGDLEGLAVPPYARGLLLTLLSPDHGPA